MDNSKYGHHTETYKYEHVWIQTHLITTSSKYEQLQMWIALTTDTSNCGHFKIRTPLNQEPVPRPTSLVQPHDAPQSIVVMEARCVLSMSHVKSKAESKSIDFLAWSSLFPCSMPRGAGTTLGKSKA